eukprot:g75703.t1
MRESRPGVRPRTELLIQKLREVQEVFPGCSEVSLISPRGHLLTPARRSTRRPTRAEDELLDIVASLLSTAQQFGATVGQSGCGVIHIQGQQRAFHCYAIGDHVLCFYSALIPAMQSDQSSDTLVERDQLMPFPFQHPPQPRKHRTKTKQKQQAPSRSCGSPLCLSIFSLSAIPSLKAPYYLTNSWALGAMFREGWHRSQFSQKPDPKTNKTLKCWKKYN